jgi:hypothetical protein
MEQLNQKNQRKSAFHPRNPRNFLKELTSYDAI